MRRYLAAKGNEAIDLLAVNSGTEESYVLVNIMPRASEFDEIIF
jgi:hypothetical protein